MFETEVEKFLNQSKCAVLEATNFEIYDGKPNVVSFIFLIGTEDWNEKNLGATFTVIIKQK